MCNSAAIVTRADHDFYPTPPEAVRALLSVEQFDGTIWEPACGDGAISRALEAHGHAVVSTDLIDRGYGEGGSDFLSPSTTARIMLEHPSLRHIVTNPPYSYRRGIADKFVGQALRVARHTGGNVAMLLNLGSPRAPDPHGQVAQQPAGRDLCAGRACVLALRQPSPGRALHHRAPLLLGDLETRAPRFHALLVAEHGRVSRPPVSPLTTGFANAFLDRKRSRL